MRALSDGPDLARLRAADPVGPIPADLAEHPSARALLAAITRFDADAPTGPIAVPVRRRRPRGRTMALGLAGAMVLAAGAYGAVLWSTDDLPPAGQGRDAFVLPSTTILPGGYESTRAPLYADLPPRPSLGFAPGTRYLDAVSAYLAARRAGAILPPGVELAAPLPAGIVVHDAATGLRLDPAAPLGYDPVTGVVTSPPAAGNLPEVEPILWRCQLLLGDESPASPACASPPADLQQVRQRDGAWVPFDLARTAPGDADGPTTVALLGRPVRPGDRVPAAVTEAIAVQAATLPPAVRGSGVTPAMLPEARRAGDALGARVWALSGTDGRICLLVLQGDGSFQTTCATDRELATRGAIVLSRTDRRTGTALWALVADGYDTASLAGANRQPVRDNFVALRAPAGERAMLALAGSVGARSVALP